ncbi:MAG: hypothetical protein AAGI38_04720 [Bacteroidota bacterium]
MEVKEMIQYVRPTQKSKKDWTLEDYLIEEFEKKHNVDFYKAFEDLYEAQTKAQQAENQAKEAKNQAKEAKNQVKEAKNQAKQAENQVKEAKNQAKEAKNQVKEVENQAREAKKRLRLVEAETALRNRNTVKTGLELNLPIETLMKMTLLSKKAVEEIMEQIEKEGEGQ